MRTIQLSGQWHALETTSEDGLCWDLSFFHDTRLVGKARLIELDTAKHEDPLEPVLRHGDVWCVQDELEGLLTESPGRYLWLDGLERTSDALEVKGQLTLMLKQVLELKSQEHGLSQGLAFPCPYGHGDEEDDPTREVLRQWYQHTLGAQSVGQTPLVFFELQGKQTLG